MKRSRGPAPLALPLILAGLGCGGAPPPAPVPAAGPPPPPQASASAVPPAVATLAPAASDPPKRRPPRSAALRFDIDGEPFPSPLVDAVVAGQPATMVVDTGATHHVVAGWLANELSIPRETGGDVGVDHAGHTVAVTRLPQAGLRLSGWGPVDVDPLLVIDVPEPLRRFGVGGFISPQALLAEGAALTLDLRAGRMTESSLAEAEKSLAAGGATVPIRVCGVANAGTRLFAAARIEGIAVEIQLDTGSWHSSLAATSEAGQQLHGRAGKATSGYAASGRYTVPTLAGARIGLGGFEIHADLDLFPRAPRSDCGGDGFLGMDVLRSCVIVVGRSTGALRCQKP